MTSPLAEEGELFTHFILFFYFYFYRLSGHVGEGGELFLPEVREKFRILLF
jgi:hypothetical protein